MQAEVNSVLLYCRVWDLDIAIDFIDFSRIVADFGSVIARGLDFVNFSEIVADFGSVIARGHAHFPIVDAFFNNDSQYVWQ